MKIVLATENQGKVKELKEILAPLAINIIPQSVFTIPEAQETGLSFIENAILKARHAALFTGLPAIADDSGIEVDYLAGGPGIYSARFASKGAHKSDSANNQKLLDKLQGLPPESRGANFRCVIAYVAHARDPSPIITEGIWHGQIMDAPSGSGGFGYDPIFYVTNHNCSASELSSETKNQISHRAQALMTLKAKLQSLHEAD